MNGSEVDNAALVVVLVLHLAWLLWVIFGVLWTRGRRWLTAFRIASLVWECSSRSGPGHVL